MSGDQCHHRRQSADLLSFHPNISFRGPQELWVKAEQGAHSLHQVQQIGYTSGNLQPLGTPEEPQTITAIIGGERYRFPFTISVGAIEKLEPVAPVMPINRKKPTR